MLNILSRDNFPNLRARLLLLAAVVVAFLPTWSGLAYIWSHTFGYAHGWLIALIALWLLLFDRTRLYFSKPSLVPLLLLAAALALWSFSRLSFTDIGAQLLLPVLAVLIAYSLYGFTGARAVAFACFYIVFAIPIWDLLIPLLQKATVFGVTHALSLIGVPNGAQGNYIHIPFGAFHVERGCSGANFVVVAIAVSLLNAKTWGLSWKRGTFAVIFATALSIFANWVRVFFIVLQAWRTDMQTTLIRNHYWFGWYLFAAALVVYFFVARMLDTGGSAKRVPTVDSKPSRPAMYLQIAATFTLIAAVTLSSDFALQRLATSSVTLPSAPVLQGSWQGPFYTKPDWHPQFPGARAYSLNIYHNATDRPLIVYRAVYTVEHEGSKIIGWGVSPVPRSWKVLHSAYLQLNKNTTYTGSPALVRSQTVMSSSGNLWMEWSWYKLGRLTYADPLRMKLAQGMEAFIPGSVDPSQVEVLAVPCYDRCEKAKQALLDFSNTELKHWN